MRVIREDGRVIGQKLLLSDCSSVRLGALSAGLTCLASSLRGTCNEARVQRISRCCNLLLTSKVLSIVLSILNALILLILRLHEEA